MNGKTGVIVGTFDPFTIGHASIVRRALPLFDRLVIGVVGDNVQKPGITPAEQRMQAIARLYAGEPRIEVRTYFGLAVDFARSVGAERTFLIHLTHNIGFHDDANRRLPDDIRFAYDGQVIEV